MRQIVDGKATYEGKSLAEWALTIDGWDQATDSRVIGWEVTQWAKGAPAYNALLVAWPEIAHLAAGAFASSPLQERML